MKWATPLFLAFSYRLPASIQIPTVAVWEPQSSVATLIPEAKRSIKKNLTSEVTLKNLPLVRLVTLVGGTLSKVVLASVAVEAFLRFLQA